VHPALAVTVPALDDAARVLANSPALAGPAPALAEPTPTLRVTPPSTLATRPVATAGERPPAPPRRPPSRTRRLTSPEADVVLARLADDPWREQDVIDLVLSTGLTRRDVLSGLELLLQRDLVRVSPRATRICYAAQ
jgi:hypothetical protein